MAVEFGRKHMPTLKRLKNWPRHCRYVLPKPNTLLLMTLPLLVGDGFRDHHT